MTFEFINFYVPIGYRFLARIFSSPGSECLYLPCLTFLPFHERSFQFDSYNYNSILFDLILFQSPKELSRLFCYYKATDDPFYVVKTELANLQPRIFLFHDIISDDEIGFLRNISEKQVSTCTDQNMSEQIFSYCK